MTTLTQVVPASNVAPDDKFRVRPARATVINAIRCDARTTWKQAESFLSWITNVATYLRRTGQEYYFPTEKELTKHHPTLVEIMPDDRYAEPDSAHDLIEAFVLKPECDEFALVHTMSGDGRTYCTVKMVLGALN